MHGGDSYGQSPDALPVRDGFYIPPYNVQQGMASPSYHPSAANQFAPETQIQYRQIPGFGGQAVHTPFGSLDDGPRPLEMGETGIGPAQYTRMTQDYGGVESQGDRRGSSYIVTEGFSDLNHDLSASLRMAPSPRSSLPITTAGSSGNTYQ